MEMHVGNCSRKIRPADVVAQQVCNIVIGSGNLTAAVAGVGGVGKRLEGIHQARQRECGGIVPAAGTNIRAEAAAIALTRSFILRFSTLPL